MNAEKKKRGGRQPGQKVIRWDREERAQWDAVLDVECHRRVTEAGITASECVHSAMQHMRRRRPSNPYATDLISQASTLLKKYRREHDAAVVEASRKPPAPANEASPPPTAQPASAPTPADPLLTAQYAGPPERREHWTEGLATDISGMLVEVIVRTAESVAVRKAVRSLIRVATDPNFTPEIDNTVVWERPTVGPRLPRVLVAGFVKHAPIRDLITQFGAQLDLRFWRSDDSLTQLRRDLQSAEHIIFMTGSTSHAAEQTIAASGKQYTRVPSTSYSSAERALQSILGEWKGGGA